MKKLLCLAAASVIGFAAFAEGPLSFTVDTKATWDSETGFGVGTGDDGFYLEIAGAYESEKGGAIFSYNGFVNEIIRIDNKIVEQDYRITLMGENIFKNNFGYNIYFYCHIYIQKQINNNLIRMLNQKKLYHIKLYYIEVNKNFYYHLYSPYK